MNEFYVKKLSLQNFKGISDITIDFQQEINAFIGINGSGKSSILFAISIALSQMIAKIKSASGKGIIFEKDYIKNKEKNSSITIDISYKNENYSWYLFQQRFLTKSSQTDLKDVRKIASLVNIDLENDEKASVPLAVFYGVDRNVLDVPLGIRDKHIFDQMASYDRALLDARTVNDFRLFFEWYRNREDLENENLRNFAKNGNQICVNNNIDLLDSQLNAVRTAIESFLPNFHNLHIQRNPLKMILHKKSNSLDNELDINQLSDGEKSTLSIVGDLARRLAIANPALKNPLLGQGIVLIDEIDLHLHPQWESEILPKFHATFPNCQFIVSTHSPLVLSQLEADSIFLLDHNEKGKIEFSHPEAAKWLTVNEILNLRMNTPNMSLANQIAEIQKTRVQMFPKKW